MIERKPPVVPFSTDEIKQFVDHFTEHGEYLRFEKHAEHEGQALAEFLGLGYLRYWTEKELTILRLNYESEGAMKTAAQLPYRTVYDVQIPFLIIAENPCKYGYFHEMATLFYY